MKQNILMSYNCDFSLTGSDIFCICENAKIRPLNKVQDSSHFTKQFDAQKQKWLYTPCSSSCAGAEEIQVEKIDCGSILTIPPTTIVRLTKRNRDIF